MSGSEFHRRPRRAVPAAVVAVALVGLGVASAWAGISQLLGRGWPAYAERVLGTLATTPWASGLGWGMAAGLAVVGLVLVLVALSPGHYDSVALTSVRADQVGNSLAYLASSGLARLAAVQARDVDGVDDVRAALVGRRLRLRLKTPLTSSSELVSQVRDVVTRRLVAAGIDPLPAISIKVTHREPAP